MPCREDFVADIRDAFDLLVAHHFGDALDHQRLVHLIGNFRDDQRFAVLAEFFRMHPPAQDHGAASRMKCRLDAHAPQNDAARRKIRARHKLNQVIDGNRRIVDGGNRGIDHFAQIMRRHVGGHAHRNAASPVHQKVWIFRRQNRGLAEFIGIVELEFDRVLVEIIEQRNGGFRQPRFRVAVGRRRIAVNRTEIALPVDQRQPQRKILRHAHQRIVNRQVAVRMIFAHHVADDAGRFLVRPCPA